MSYFIPFISVVNTTIKFADLFTNVVASVQTDLALTYSGGFVSQGTTPPALSITGTLTAGLLPCPVRVTCTGAGALGTWTYNVYYDGGTTPAMSGTSSATISLTGLAAGLVLNIAAGTAATNNIWDATAVTLPDVSGHSKDFTQPTSSHQPIITKGLNGFPAVLLDGVDDTLDCTSLTLPDQAVTPVYIWALFRRATWVSTNIFYGDIGSISRCLLDYPASPQMSQYCNITANAGSPGTGLPAGTWGVVDSYYTSSTSDSLRVGSSAIVSGTSSGTAHGTGFQIGNCANLGSRYSNMELLAMVFITGTPTPTQIANARAAATAKYGVTVAV